MQRHTLTWIETDWLPCTPVPFFVHRDSFEVKEAYGGIPFRSIKHWKVRSNCCGKGVKKFCQTKLIKICETTNFPNFHVQVALKVSFEM